MSKRRIKKLSPEAKKAVWAKPQANAGAGWNSYGHGTDPLQFEQGEYEDFADLPLDDPFAEDGDA